jgi:hypothetical protein
MLAGGGGGRDLPRRSLSQRLVAGFLHIDDNIPKVEVKIGTAKYKTAKSTAKWRFTTGLKPGKTRSSPGAVGPSGLTSAPAKITVTRATP